MPNTPKCKREDRRAVNWAIVPALAVFCIFFELGRMDIVWDNEGQRATPPAEMIRTGNYLIPTINGVDYLAKPPLLYWAIAAVYSTTGMVSEWTARVPTAASAVFLVIAVYALTRRELGERPARWAALTLLASPYFLDRARWADLDVPLTLAVFLSIMALREASAAQTITRSVFMTCLSGIALGAAAMLKGPPPFVFVLVAGHALLLEKGGFPIRILRTGIQWSVGLMGLAFTLWILQALLTRFGLARVFPVYLNLIPLILFAAMWAILAWSCASGRGRRRDLVILASVFAMGVAIATPWAWMVVGCKGWPYISALIQQQVLQRTYTASDINGGNPFYYFGWLVLMVFPWSFLLPFHFRSKPWANEGSLYRFATVTGWLGVATFSLFAAKEKEYILPALPFLMIGIGCHVANVSEDSRGLPAGRWINSGQRVLLGFMPVVATGAAAYYLSKYRQPLLIIELVSGTLLVWGTILTFRNRPGLGVHRLLAATLLALMVVLVGRSYHYALDQRRSPKTLALACRALIENRHTVEITPRVEPLRMFPYPPLAFYLAHPIPMEERPEVVVEKLAGTEPYFYLTREKLLKDWLTTAPTPSRPFILGPFTNKDLVLISNRPLPDLPAVRMAHAVLEPSSQD